MAVRRRRFKQPTSLLERLGSWPKVYRRAADALPEGTERSAMLKKAQQCDAAAHLDGWLRSRELTPPA